MPGERTGEASGWRRLADSPGWRRLAGPVDLALRITGGVLAVLAAALTAVLELLLATLRVGGHLIGVSALLAVVANVALSWFARRAVGRGWAVALPAVTWFAFMVVAAGGTTEGDILLAGNNWVGLAMIVAGSMAFAVMAFRIIVAPRPGPGPGIR
ncbi:hypothetical protein O7627_28580 [Solwaraspora sp. WMMD1047]|uniref:hypothetical protein n=1 Tax=Solwaraspora sp. WMMD1047 TaxID=3016102 RepID=UPI0024160913|nr:hypothetical protein [Solwaraspora sp. WMMD1047]MDG4833232.1 hypothetical protein [Solwaraspora sp. WMMD1047]